MIAMYDDVTAPRVPGHVVTGQLLVGAVKAGEGSRRQSDQHQTHSPRRSAVHYPRTLVLSGRLVQRRRASAVVTSGTAAEWSITAAKSRILTGSTPTNVSRNFALKAPFIGRASVRFQIQFLHKL